jgi:hypothetical protein
MTAEAIRLHSVSSVVGSAHAAGQHVIRYKVAPSLTKDQKQKALARLLPWQLDVFVSNFTGSAEWSSRRSADEKKVCVELPQNYFYQVVGG